MLGLKVGNIWLDLDAKTTASIQMNNPIFDKDSLARTFSFPFTLPLSARNKTALSHQDRLDSAKKNNKLPAKLYLLNNLFEVGFLEVKSYKGRIKVIFKNPERNLVDDLEKTKINQICDTIEIQKLIEPIHRIGFNNHPPFTYTLTINEVTFTHQENTDSAQNASETLRDLINDEFPNLASAETTTTLGSQIILKNNTEKGLIITLDSGLAMFSMFSLAEARESNLKVHRNIIVHLNNSESHSMPPIYNVGAYDQKNTAWQKIFNKYPNAPNNSHFPITNDEGKEISPAWEHSFIPCVRLPYLVGKIFEHNTEIHTIAGTIYESNDIQSLVIYNNVTLDEVFTFSDIDFTGTVGEVVTKNGGRDYINLNDHLPEMTGLEFFSIFLDFFALYPTFEGKTAILHKKNERINRPPLDWTKKAEPEYQKTMTDDNGFVLSLLNDSNDNYNSDQLNDYTESNGNEEIQLPAGTLAIAENLSGPGELIPIVDQKVTTEELSMGSNSYELRFLFDRGEYTNNDGFPYQLATNGNLDGIGNKVGDLTLLLHGEDSLYQKHWKELAKLKNNETITFIMRLSITDLLQIRKWQDFRIVIKHPKGQFEGFIKSVKIKANMQGLSLASVQFIRAI